MALDDAPSPVVGHGIADGAEEAAHTGGLKNAAAQAQLDGIELDSIRAGVHVSNEQRPIHGFTGQARSPITLSCQLPERSNT